MTSKKRTVAAAVLLGILMVPAVTAALSTVRMSRPPLQAEAAPLALSPRENGIKMTRPHNAPAVSSSLVFYEDFESVSGEEPYPLPEGWSATATPGFPDDIWKAGSLYDDKGKLPGSSGEKYAFLLSNTMGAHDTWLYTPAFRLEAGKTYKFSSKMLMPANGGRHEDIKIMVFKASDVTPGREIAVITDVADDIQAWSPVNGYIEVDEEGEYVVGFHDSAVSNSGGVVLDDVAVADMATPVYYGQSYIDFPQTYDISAPVTVEYTIYNDGYEPLEVSLRDASPELSVEGLPTTIQAESHARIKVTADVNEPGAYQGFLRLITNDPLSPEIVVKVYQEVVEAVYSDPEFCGFDDGTPLGYELCHGSANMLAYGMGGSRCFSANTFHGLASEDLSVSVTTNFVRLGQNPVLRFAYACHKSDKLMNDTGEPVPADMPLIEIYVSDEKGMEWNLIKSISADHEDKYIPSGPLQTLDLRLPEYAGRTARACIKFKYRSGKMMDIMQNPYNAVVDNIMFGTFEDSDIAVACLEGPGTAVVGERKKYTVTVENRGLKDFKSDYEVALYDKEGNKVAMASGKPVAAGATADHMLTFTPKDTGKQSLTARITSGSDAVLSNNESRPLYLDVFTDRTIHRIIQNNYTDSLGWSLQLPVHFYAVKARSASMYKANEIGVNRGRISSVTYKVAGARYKADNMKFYVAETLNDEFSTDDALDPSEMTLVFDGTIDFPSGNYEATIPFDTPYEYKGGNLIICGVRDSDEFVYGRSTLSSLATTSRSIVYEDDYAPAAPCLYANVALHLEEAATGSITGTVRDGAGNPIAGARVGITGEAYCGYTDSNGRYTLGNVAVGEYDIEVSVLRFQSASRHVTVKENEGSTLDFVLQDHPRVEVSGTVRDTDGNPIAGTTVSFTGDVGDMTTTDVNGKWSVNLYAENDYTATAVSPYYSRASRRFTIGSDPMKLDFTVVPELTHPHAPVVAIGDGKARVSWNIPIREIRHDTGNPVTVVGFDEGYSEIIFGSAYHENATVNEVSFYISSAGGYHENFHVFVFGLTDGLPDANKILYRADDVDFVDDAWNTHVLATPVTADGFMVAVSCAYFMGLGVTAADEDYPYEYGNEFYAGDSYRFHISEMGTYSKDAHWMLRAGVEHKDEDASATRPSVKGYRLYRALAGSTDWTLVGDTESNTFEDDIMNLPEGRYRWAVATAYENGFSHPVICLPAYVDPSEIEEIGVETVTFNYNAANRSINTGDGNGIVSMDIYNAAGMRIVHRLNPSGSFSLEHLSAGMYVATATLADGSMSVLKIII